MKRHVVLVIAIVALIVTGLPDTATAFDREGGRRERGCFQEFQECADCVDRLKRKAIKKRDWQLLQEAFTLALDCNIDLYHCIFLGKHHPNEQTCDERIL